MSAADRSLSPTEKLWDGRRQAQEKMVKMMKMGLHVFNPAWQATMDSRTLGSKYSAGFTETTLRIPQTEEKMTFPVQQCTRVRDLREAIANATMVSPEEITFVVKAGCTYKKMFDHEELARTMLVRGIKKFKPTGHVWPHPISIIGAGYNGIKTCIHYLKEDNKNIVCFDRNDKVGGYCWITAANKTSKLQTEFGSFHVWWGPEYARSQACGGWPHDHYAWPGKTAVLEHFDRAAKDYGMHPYVRFRTNVVEMDIVGPKDEMSRYYNLTVKHLDKDESFTMPVSVMYNFPGSMTKNRIVEFPGEDAFDGYIGYGMNDDMPFEHLGNTGVAILGNGAFAVENVRTCVEHGSKKVYVVTRRKNLPSPRVPCWFVHQGPIPTPGRLVLDMFAPMFSLCNMGDPWDYWSVHAPADRARATIVQNSRFGIGDVTFCAHACGLLEYVEDTLKRLTKHTLHLNGGGKLEGVTGIVKSLGLLGDYEVDKLHKMDKLVGNWCDGDWRRYLAIDPTGMNAANFTTFSLGIGVYGGTLVNAWLYNNPHEMYQAMDKDIMAYLPVNKAKPAEDKPAYVTDVKYAQSAGMITSSFFPMTDALQAEGSAYKHALYHALHPTDQFIAECVKDWDKYQALFKENGCEHEYIPYPYTRQMVDEYMADYSQSTKWPISADGVDEAFKRGCVERALGTEAQVYGAMVPQLVRDVLHPKCPGDPWALAEARLVHAGRDKLMSSSPGSAMDFDLDAYGKWSAWTAAECTVEDVQASSGNILTAADTWQAIYSRLERVKAPAPK